MVQRHAASWIAEVLSEMLQTRCEIGNVDFGFLNRVVIDDLKLLDRQDKDMLSVARVSASIDYLSLLEGEIVIPTAQLFSADAHLYCDSVGAEYNFQFVIDAFKSDNKEQSKTPHIRVNSLIVRHTNISHDILSEPHPVAVLIDEQPLNRFTISHLRIQDLALNLSLKHFSDDSLNVSVKRLGFTEPQTGLVLSNLDFMFEANRQQAVLGTMNLRCGHSVLSLDTVKVAYPDFNTDGSFDMQSTVLRCSLVPSDFRSFVPALQRAYSPIELNLRAKAEGGRINMQDLRVSGLEDGLFIQAEGNALLSKEFKLKDAALNIVSLRTTTAGMQQLALNYGLSDKVLENILKVGNIEMKAAAHYVPEQLTTDGTLATDVGSLDFEALMDSAGHFSADVSGDSISLAKYFDNPQYGKLTFNATASGEQGKLSVANVTALLKNHETTVSTDIDYCAHNGMHRVAAKAEADKVNLAGLGVKGVGEDERFDVALDANLYGSNIDNLLGDISLRDFRLTTPQDTIRLGYLGLTAVDDNHVKHYNVSSDFFDLNVNGRILPSQVPGLVMSLLSSHLPTVVKPVNFHKADADFNYNFSIKDHPLLHHYVEGVPVVASPLTSHGNISSSRHSMNVFVNAPHLIVDETNYRDLSLRLHNNSQGLSLDVSGLSQGEKSSMDMLLAATASHDKVDAYADLRINGKSAFDLRLNAVTQFSDSLGKMLANINVRNSSLTINDTLWNVKPAQVRIHGGEIDIDGFGVSSGDRFLNVQGRASKSANDSIVAELNNIDVKYVLDIVRFKTVRFSGDASGRAVVKGVMSNPNLLARLYVRDFLFQDGRMGDADITGRWDNENKSILLDAHIVDYYRMTTDLMGSQSNKMGVTDVHGFVSPANKELNLAISVQDTHIDFLNGFVDGFMGKVDGCVSGKVNVVGPFSDVNLIGDVDATANLSLRATRIPYHIENQRVAFRKGAFSFDGIALSDQYGNEGLLNGRLAHRNLANFTYSFDVGFHEFLLYDEKKFNSDKFYATVFGNGNLSVEGRDGHPMTINANVTPTRGSVFAYDTASPDALTNSSFIEFRNKQRVETEVQEDESYSSDLYINFNLNLDNNCEIRLRMDNKPDGYISTFGHANIQARYYNKSGIQLFGNYNIDQGNYRLYLQDLIYKDLAMQPGSKVEFNGAPFDANLHLICHHTINSVPISDLTASRGVSQSNKVKVVCVLDITGNLDNMNFKFDLSLPNVSDEMRQLVRSVISTEEEMNTQMIYLLGFNRFYPTGFASAETQGGTGTSAVNSLVSSTISGQVNKFISTVMGKNSNWSVGTGIATGERGWKDLDVEGTLSGRLFDDRLLINGNFGYRDNVMTNKGTFIGDFEVKWRVKKNGKLFLKAYNQTNDRYFTKATLNTQGIGISFQHDFESWRTVFLRQRKKEE